MPAGIVGGPVQLIQGNKTIDLSNSTWSYKVYNMRNCMILMFLQNFDAFYSLPCTT